MGYPQEVSICSKYFLFLCNTVFWVLSIILLTIGGWAWWAKGFFENLDQLAGIPIDPVLLIVGIGVTMFVVSFTGCLGALRENIMLLKFFSGVLGIIFFGQLVIGILSFIYKDWFTRKVEEIVMHTIVSYRDDPDLQNIIDLTQSSLECCGISEPGDWEKNIYFNCSATVQVNGIEYKPAEHCGVPFSCCKPELIEVNGTEVKDVANTQCGYGVLAKSNIDDEIYTNGCVNEFENWMSRNLYTVAGAFIGFALFQIIPICVAQGIVQDIETIQEAGAFNRRRPNY